MGLDLGRNDGFSDLGGDAGDGRQIEPWLEEQCGFKFMSMLGLGLGCESDVGLHHQDDDKCTAVGGGRESFGFGVRGADGGPSRADSPLLSFGWHWDSPETESLAAPPPGIGLLPETATQADASAPGTAHLSGISSLSTSLSSTPSSSFMPVLSTAGVAIHGAHVKNSSNQPDSPTNLTATMTATTPTPTTVLDGTVKWGHSRWQASTASMLNSAYFHAQHPRGPPHQLEQQNQQQPMPTSPPSSPPTRHQSRTPSVSVVSSSMAVVPPRPHSHSPMIIPLPNTSNSSLNLDGDESSYPQQQHQRQQYVPLPHTPTISLRPSMTTTSPKFPMPSAQAMKVENALMDLSPSLPSLSSLQPSYAQQYHHPNESSSSDGNHQQQTQGRGLGGRKSGGGSGGGALSTLLLGLQKKAPKRKLIVKGVAMGDVDAYEAIKRWCEVGCFFSSLLVFFRSLFGVCWMRVYHTR